MRFQSISLRLVAFILPLVCLIGSAHAETIAVFNFNDRDLVVDRGAGTLTTNVDPANVVFLGGNTNNADSGDSAGLGVSFRNGTNGVSNGRFLTLAASTVGFQNIMLSFAIQRTPTGFNNDQFQFSLDGVNFTNFGAPFLPGIPPVVSFDLSAIAGLNNNANAAFRVVFNGGVTTNALGNNLIDNLVLEGTPGATAVPEPASMVLVGTGLIGLIGLVGLTRRRARAAA